MDLKCIKNGKLIRKSEKKLMDYFIEYIQQKKQLSIPPLGRQIDISKK